MAHCVARTAFVDPPRAVRTDVPPENPSGLREVTNVGHARRLPRGLAGMRLHSWTLPAPTIQNPSRQSFDTGSVMP